MTVKLAIEFLKVIRQINLVKCSYEFGDKLNINIFRNRKSPSTCSIWKLIITQTLVNIKRYQRDIKNYAKTLIAVRASAFLDFSEILTVPVQIWCSMHHCKNSSNIINSYSEDQSGGIRKYQQTFLPSATQSTVQCWTCIQTSHSCFEG